jgi:chromosome condensin MukBEF MukE localization factor
MEHQDQETFLKLSTYNFERFGETDNLLRSGAHIQSHKSQRQLFNFIEDNIEPLTEYYERLYKAKLCEEITVDNKFYYLDATGSQNKVMNKEKLDQRIVLFAIFLYYLQKVEKQFSVYLSKQEIIEAINSNHSIKPHIQKLFFGTEKEDTSSVQKTIDNWVSSSLRQLVKLGWIYFPDEDDEKFETLPAFERIALIYHEAINDIDNIKTSCEILTNE